jgi:gas vesicle protein
MNGFSIIQKLICTVNKVWRLYAMRQQAMGFLKGVGAGMVAGAAIAMMNDKMMKNNRNYRRNANKTMRAMEQLFSNIQGMF